MFAIELPPLRERREDIPLLVQTFLNEFNATQRARRSARVDQEAMQILEQYPWPGNIRELRNVIERATILAESEFIEPRHLPPPLVSRGEETLPTMTLSPGTTVDEAERRLILLTLDHTRNNKTRAAEILGISLKTLHNKLNRMKDEEACGSGGWRQPVAGADPDRPQHAVSIKAKQVAGVTTLVVVIVAVLSAYHLATLTRLSLQETASRGELLAQAIFQRAREVVAQGAGRSVRGAARRRRHPVAPRVEHRLLAQRHLRGDRQHGRRRGRAQLSVARRASRSPEQEDLAPLVDGSAARAAARRLLRSHLRGPAAAARRRPASSASIRIGVSTLLVRSELRQALTARRAATVLVALLISTLVAMLLAQWMLRPIHVIQSGLTRLGRGELDVRLDLPEQEFRDLGSSFDAVSAQLSAMGRESAPGRRMRGRAARPTSSRSWTTSRTPSRCSRRAAS